jgi:hypothetical protein
MRIFVTTVISVCMLASSVHSQTSKDQGVIRIMRSGPQPSRQAPAENFTGSVRVDPLFQANAQEELIEIVTHLAFYSGWPNAVNAINVAREVFEEK